MSRTLDVAVIGGGVSGVAAALAASGSSEARGVGLFEASSSLGGMGVRAQVNTICGLYLGDEQPRLANGGLCISFEKALRAGQKSDGLAKMGRVWVLKHEPAALGALLRSGLARRSREIDLYLNHQVKAVERCADGFRIQYSNDAGQLHTLDARALVDCTADAHLAPFLGVGRERHQADRLQRPAIICGIRGMKSGALTDRFLLTLAVDIAKSVRAGLLSPGLLGATFRQSPQPGLAFVSLDLDPLESWEPSDPVSVHKTLKEGESLIKELFGFLRDRYDAFAYLEEPLLPEVLGVRESFQWRGQYRLSGGDLMSNTSFSDEIAKASWPIELREKATGPSFEYFQDPCSGASIPVRSLRSAYFPSVFMAGRCLSATHRALGSVRVMGTGLATGQAAGAAAALVARDGPTAWESADGLAEQVRYDLKSLESMPPFPSS